MHNKEQTTTTIKSDDLLVFEHDLSQITKETISECDILIIEVGCRNGLPTDLVLRLVELHLTDSTKAIRFNGLSPLPTSPKLAVSAEYRLTGEDRHAH